MKLLQHTRFAFFTLAVALTMTACSQPPTGVPTNLTTLDVETSGLFPTTDRKLVVPFLLASARGREVTRFASRKVGTVHPFTATVKAWYLGSGFWPTHANQPWEGHLTFEKPLRTPDLTRVHIQGRYVKALPGQADGPGPWVTKVVEIQETASGSVVK